MEARSGSFCTCVRKTLVVRSERRFFCDQCPHVDSLPPPLPGKGEDMQRTVSLQLDKQGEAGAPQASCWAAAVALLGRADQLRARAAQRQRTRGSLSRTQNQSESAEQRPPRARSAHREGNTETEGHHSLDRHARERSSWERIRLVPACVCVCTWFDIHRMCGCVVCVL